MYGFPKNTKAFMETTRLNYKLLNIYNSIGSPKPFDVSLRDGLQGLNKEKQGLFTTQHKIKLYNEIVDKHSPSNIEIGSFVNYKILPVFKDTEKLLNCLTKDNDNSNNINNINNYVLVPNMIQLQNALKAGAASFSFITSVSDSFQYKNTKMLLDENLSNINDMMVYLDDYRNFEIDSETGNIIANFRKKNVKIYVSCINRCPIEGEIKTSRIISQLIKINKLNPDKICLSDTCGTLTPENFTSIINYCKKAKIDIKKFSLHLHIKPEMEDIVQEIVFIALDNGINEFDVSHLSTGGCSVTMDKDKLAPNMNYEQYYKFLMNYMISRI